MLKIDSHSPGIRRPACFGLRSKVITVVGGAPTCPLSAQRLQCPQELLKLHTKINAFAMPIAAQGTTGSQCRVSGPLPDPP